MCRNRDTDNIILHYIKKQRLEHINKMGGFKLEFLKFGLYLIVPACTVAYFERPEVFQQILRRRKYIVYEGTGEDRDDLDTLLKKNKEEMKRFSDKL